MNKGTGDIQIVGRTCEQIIRDALNTYGLPEYKSGVNERAYPPMSATGTFTFEVFSRFIDSMIQSEQAYPYGVPDYQWIQDMRNE